MHKCRFCGHRFDTADEVLDHEEHVTSYDPILCS
jgi:hypothetical protein